MSRVLFTIYLYIIGTNLASREFSVLAGRTQDLTPRGCNNTIFQI